MYFAVAKRTQSAPPMVNLTIVGVGVGAIKILNHLSLGGWQCHRNPIQSPSKLSKGQDQPKEIVAAGAHYSTIVSSATKDAFKFYY